MAHAAPDHVSRRRPGTGAGADGRAGLRRGLREGARQTRRRYESTDIPTPPALPVVLIRTNWLAANKSDLGGPHPHDGHQRSVTKRYNGDIKHWRAAVLRRGFAWGAHTVSLMPRYLRTRSTCAAQPWLLLSYADARRSAGGASNPDSTMRNSTPSAVSSGVNSTSVVGSAETSTASRRRTGAGGTRTAGAARPPRYAMRRPCPHTAPAPRRRRRRRQ